ncbi:MAG: hypothetical protein MUO82_05320 [Candidatus Thermoplasmatota archaeon]|nr:hypothetical protein [Candidatus Thermoplasmatota archaeon]
MRKDKILNKLVIFAIAALMCLSVGPIAVNAVTGDTCSDPYIVNIPSSLPYSVSHTTNGFNNDYYSTTMGYYDDGLDTIYRLVVASTTQITVTCTPVGTYQYAGIGLFAGCPDSNPTALIYSTASTGPVSFVYTCSPGTYYLMVDNWPSPAYITYTLTITGGIQPGADCTSAIQAVAGINSASKQPIWYKYTPTEDCLLEITSNNLGQSVDTYLYVYDACGGTLVASKDDDNSGYYSYASTVSFNAYAGTDYKIFWDDYWETSAFLFKITEITGCDVGVTSIIHPNVELMVYKNLDSYQYQP